MTPTTNPVEYMAWQSMKTRCHNPRAANYPRYGGRGIVVAECWRCDPAAFLAHVGPRPSSRHSLDRFPNTNGNYEPGNVRWATPREQSNNTRANILLTFRGETKTLADWAREVGMGATMLHNRLKYMSVEDALMHPKGKHFRKRVYK